MWNPFMNSFSVSLNIFIASQMTRKWLTHVLGMACQNAMSVSLNQKERTQFIDVTIQMECINATRSAYYFQLNFSLFSFYISKILINNCVCFVNSMIRYMSQMFCFSLFCFEFIHVPNVQFLCNNKFVKSLMATCCKIPKSIVFIVLNTKKKKNKQIEKTNQNNKTILLLLLYRTYWKRVQTLFFLHL